MGTILHLAPSPNSMGTGTLPGSFDDDTFCFSSPHLRGGLTKDKLEAHLVELPQSRWSTSVLGKKLDGCFPGICCCPHRKAGNNSRSLQQTKMNVQHINAMLRDTKPFLKPGTARCLTIWPVKAFEGSQSLLRPL